MTSDPASEGPSRPRPIRLLRAVVKKARTDTLGLQSAALAFTTIVSLIPLLAAISDSGIRAFAASEEQLVGLLVTLLPWSEDAITAQLREFLRQAKALRGVGVAAFFVTCLAMFSTIERTLNQVWNVSRLRPLRNRLLSFSLVLFWGPLVIGATYGLLFKLHANPVWETVSSSLPVQLLPTIVTTFGLTMLYWLVPYTAVSFRAALTGGVFSGALFAGLRFGFAAYVDKVPTVSLIYGGFGLALLFMMSLHIAWWIALLGSVVAWAVQNSEHLDLAHRSAAPLDGPAMGLAATLQLTRNFLGGSPITPHDRLAEKLGIRSDDLQRILAPLVARGILQQTGGDDEGVLLAGDPHEITAGRILAAYEDLAEESRSSLAPPVAAGLERLAADERTLLKEGRNVSLHFLVTASAEDEPARETGPTSLD